MRLHKPPLALFLDRDGTLIVDEGYLSDPQKVCLLPEVRETLAVLKSQGALFFLHSNQSGVGRGYYTLKEAEACNQRMLDLLGLGNDLFTEVCLATGTPENPCPYRKPSPRFILECIQKYHLDPEKCWMVGDRLCDVEAGLAAHINAICLDPKVEIPVEGHHCHSFGEILNLVR